jgi:hypothetical protein
MKRITTQEDREKCVEFIRQELNKPNGGDWTKYDKIDG